MCGELRGGVVTRQVAFAVTASGVLDVGTAGDAVADPRRHEDGEAQGDEVAAVAGEAGAAELRAVARQLGVDITPAEVADMVAEFAGEGGAVGPAEFAAIMAEAGDG